MCKLNILICHLPERQDFLRRLSALLDPQIREYKNDVKVLICDSRYKSIGKKRNDLMYRVDADYSCFIDDDDRVSKDYIKHLLEGIEKGVDCCSLTGEITENGQNPKKFIHSIVYDHYFEEGGIYFRPPNHLNCIKFDIGRLFQFPEKNYGEDTDWAMQIARSGMLRSEHYIENTIYYYDYIPKK